MNIEMVKILTHIRKNPGISKEKLIQDLELTEKDCRIALLGLELKNLITIGKNHEIVPEKESEFSS